MATADGLAPAAAAQLWRELATAAESGWDFSSRWLADGTSLRSCRATRVVPADLNALLYQVECGVWCDLRGAVQVPGAEWRQKAAVLRGGCGIGRWRKQLRFSGPAPFRPSAVLCCAADGKQHGSLCR